ncbi:MAG: isoamylase early set domain-containing protein [Candidatus Omnitrophica bacterium]|nr:isoamylase early set domain-containing protein [Candidatus Omnitrophota bacterium]
MEPKALKRTVRKIQFEYDAPSARSVFLAGSFNDWDLSASSMKKDRKGKWQITLQLAPGRYEYRYFVDGVWECDPDPKECVPNPFGSWNCVINVE